MGFEPRVGSQIARADLKLQFHRGAITTACHTALAYVGRALGEGPYETEHSRPCVAHGADLAMPLEIKDVLARAVGVGAGQCKSPVALTPCFDMR